MTRFIGYLHHYSVDFVKFYKIGPDDDANNVIVIVIKLSFYRQQKGRHVAVGISRDSEAYVSDFEARRLASLASYEVWDYAGLSRHAAYLNSGIFPPGSSAGLVSTLAAASTKAKGTNTMPSGIA